MAWKGTISIKGVFLIPIKMDKATKESKTAFHEYHQHTDGTLGNGGRKVYCKSCGHDLAAGDIIKGVEIGKEVLTFTEDEIKSLPLSTQHTVNIDRFVGVEEIVAIPDEEVYHVIPDKLGETPFALFVEGLKKTHSAAIGKVAIKQRESLVAFLPKTNGYGLTAHLLPWAEEVKAIPQAPVVTITDEQRDMFSGLVNKMKKPFNHSDYSDDYDNAVKTLVLAKQSGKPIVIANQTARPQQSIDDALKALEALS
jgi:DNA end-binding protein Ku